MTTHAGSRILWQRYLHHATSHLGRFKLSSATNTFQDAIETLTLQMVGYLVPQIYMSLSLGKRWCHILDSFDFGPLTLAIS